MPPAQSVEDLPTTTFSGRRFTRAQLGQIVEMVQSFPGLSRQELAETLCENLDWRNPRGGNKTACALKLLETLEAHGLCSLPGKRETAAPVSPAIDLSLAEKEPEPSDAVETSLNALLPIKLVKVQSAEEHAAFIASIEAHHYLGNARPIGSYIEYFIVSQQTGQRLGCIRYAASSSWGLPARDHWIGWDKKQRDKSRHRVLTQQRFLLFPWVKVQNLASHVLALSEQRIVSDWAATHGYKPVLLETFVDSTKDGVSYKAANWVLVGQTQRRAQKRGAPKSVFVRPLCADFREALTENLTRRAIAKRDRESASGTANSPGIDPAFIALWKKVLHLLNDVADTYDARWRKRRRTIHTKLIILFIFKLIMGKNRQSYGTTSDELWANLALLEERRPTQKSPASSAWCQARKKLDESVFKELNRKIFDTYAVQAQTNDLWFGRRVFAVDGSKINLPPPLLAAGYPTAGGNHHYAQGLLSCLYELKSKLPLDFDLVAHCDERRCAQEHLAALKPGDVVVYDRGYFSYAMLQEHVDAGVDAVFRMNERSAAVIDEFMASDSTDAIVTVFPSEKTLANLRKERPDLKITPQRLRLVKYVAEGTSYCVGTTITEPEQAISSQDLSDLYHCRWGIEELYKVSKRIIHIEEFHSEYERGIKQEVFAHLVLVTMNRLFANEAERKLNSGNGQASRQPQQCPTTTSQQVNFKNCVHVVGNYIEGLLNDPASATEASELAHGSIMRQRRTTRPGRHYERRSLRPRTKWSPTRKSHKKRVTAKHQATSGTATRTAVV